MTIEQELKELEKKKAELEKKQKASELEQKLNDIKNKLEGKVFCYFVKTNQKSSHIYLTYYKQFSTEEVSVYDNNKRGKESVVNVKKETVSVQCNCYGKTYRIEYTTEDEHYREDPDYIVYKQKEISISDFKQLCASIKAVGVNYTNQVEELTLPEYQLNGIESDIINTTLNQKELLDVPHIVLSQEESWLLKNTVFLVGYIFLLTPNSMIYLQEWLQKEKDWDSFCSTSCASVGERWRNSKMDRVSLLYNKITKAYDSIRKNQ